MSNIYNQPKLTTSSRDKNDKINNDKYIDELKLLNRYKENQQDLRTTTDYINDLSQFTANNNIQKNLINKYIETNKNKYVNIDDDIELYNPNIEYNKTKGTLTNTTLRYIDHYINIDSSLRRKEPIITYDGNYINLEDNCLIFTENETTMKIKCNENFKVNDKIILEGVSPKVSKYIQTSNITFTPGNTKVIIDISNSGIEDIFPSSSDNTYLQITDYTNYNIYGNSINYVGNIPLTLINDYHKFYIDEENKNIIYFDLPFKYYEREGYNPSNITRTFKITYFFYLNIPIYYINAFYPNSIYAKKSYHQIKEITDEYIIVDIGIKAEKNFTFGQNIRIRKILKYEKGYEEPNDYVLELTETYKNIVCVELISSEFPCIENTIYKNQSNKTNLIKNYNENQEETFFVQNNKFYWQNEDDGNYIYEIELDVGKYTMKELIKELENKIYNTGRIFYDSLITDKDINYNNHNIIKVDCNIDKDLITFKSFNEYDYDKLKRCDYEGNLDENGDYMTFTLDYDNETEIIINNEEIPIIKSITTGDYTKYIVKYVKSNDGYFYTKNKFRLLFNYDDTFGKMLGFKNVGKDTSITQYNYEITNKMPYSPILGLTLENDDINTGNSIDLSGHNYLLIVCKEFPVMDNVLNVNKNQAFAKILLYGVGGYVQGTDYGNYMGGNFIYNSFVKMKKYYYTPIHEISRLTFEFYSPTGELYDFNGIDHSFTIKITTLENILDHTNINSHTESMI